jgi:hypothetical protein
MLGAPPVSSILARALHAALLQDRGCPLKLNVRVLVGEEGGGSGYSHHLAHLLSTFSLTSFHFNNTTITSFHFCSSRAYAPVCSTFIQGTCCQGKGEEIIIAQTACDAAAAQGSAVAPPHSTAAAHAMVAGSQRRNDSKHGKRRFLGDLIACAHPPRLPVHDDM